MLAFDRDIALAAAQPRLVRRLPVRLLVHRAALPAWRRRRWRSAPSRSACPPSPTRPGRRATTSSAIFFLLAAVAIASTRLEPAERGPSAGLAGRGAARRRPRGRPGGRHQAQLPAARLRSSSSASRWSRPPGAGASLGAGGLAAWPGAATGTCATSSTPATRCPGSTALGPISLPGPDQELGGREDHSVLSYLTDGTVWSDWFLPGLHHGLGVLLAAARRARPGRPRCSPRPPRREPRSPAGVAGARRPRRRPRLAGGADLRLRARGDAARLRVRPALPGAGPGPRPGAAPPRRSCGCASRRRRGRPPIGADTAKLRACTGRHCRAAGAAADRLRSGRRRRDRAATSSSATTCANRYANPTFTDPGPERRLRMGDAVSGARIATTSTRQYPLFGTDLSNRVEFVGEERPHGGFVAPTTCRAWRRLLDEGDYDYVVASRDRIEPGQPPYPATARWTEGPGAKVILRKPPTVVFKLTDLDPSACGRSRIRRCGAHRRGAFARIGAETSARRPLDRTRAPIAILRTADGPHPQLLDHRPHRPRQVDPGRPHPRGHRRRRPEENAGADARLDGPRARARDHDQGPGGAGRVQGRRRADLPPAPDRHARPRRLLLRGLAQPRRLRGRPARRRRRPGGRGADRRQHLPGDRERAGADPGHQQGRPARRRARAGRPGDRRPARRRPRGSAAGSRPRPGRGCVEVLEAIVDRIPPPEGRARGAAAGADLRLRVRPVPRRDRLRADGRRLLPQERADPGDAERHRGRHRRHRLLPAGDDRGRGDGRRRRRLPDHRHQGRRQAARRRHADRPGAAGRRAAGGLPRGAADGLLRALPDRHRPLRRPARRAREARPQRRRALLGAGDLGGARLRLPLRLPRPPPHGDRARAAGARVRPRPAGDDAERALHGPPDQRRDESRSTARPGCPTRASIEAIEEPYIRATIIAPPSRSAP